MSWGELRMTFVAPEWLLLVHYVTFGAGCLTWHPWPCHDEPAEVCPLCGDPLVTHLRGVSWSGLRTIICRTSAHGHVAVSA